jgi:hypothetical protein
MRSGYSKGWYNDETYTSSKVEDLYGEFARSSPSITEQATRRIRESETILKALRQQSERLNKMDTDIKPINDDVMRDCQEFLSEFLRRAPLPDIDWEEDTGFLNLYWRISEKRILTVLFRGDSYAIFSGVFENDQVIDGTPLLSCAVDIISSVFQKYCNNDDQREATSRIRGH